MKAVELTRFGGPEVLHVVDTTTPNPGPGQVLVRVAAAGVNFADTLMRQNRYAITPPLPAVLGHEAAGVIADVGEGVTGLAVGTRVAAPLFAARSWFGGYAEYVVIDAEFAVVLPDAISYEVATALMVQGLTALYLTRQAPPAGKTVLINAAAGGVGSLLVQLARRGGATVVVAAASTDEKCAVARTLGANVGVNYTQSRWPEEVRAATGGRGPDIIYESAGGAVTSASLSALAPLGRMVVYGALNIQAFNLGVPELLTLIFMNQSLTGFALAPLLSSSAQLKSAIQELFALELAGALRVSIGATFALEHAADAHATLERRATVGKVLIVP